MSFERTIQTIDHEIERVKRKKEELQEENSRCLGVIETNTDTIKNQNAYIEELESSKKLLEGAFD